MRFAILSDNIVTNIIEGDGSTEFFEAFPNAVAWKAPGAVGSTYDADAKTFSEPPASTEPVWLSATDFMRRFTLGERVAIRGSTDPVVVDFLDLLDKSPNVNLKDALTIQGIQYLEAQGLLTNGRSAQILA